MAMAGPTGISGGSATVVVPLLRPDIQIAFRTTDLTGPIDKGTEKIDGVECTKIQGKGFGDSDVTLWLDGDLGIRKVYTVQVIDPAKIPQAGKGEKFTVRTTITLTPVFNEKIDDAAFAAPATK